MDNDYIYIKLRSVIIHPWVIDGWCIACKIGLRWISLDLTYDKSTLIRVMAWCLTAWCLLTKFLSPYAVTRANDLINHGTLFHHSATKYRVFSHVLSIHLKKNVVWSTESYSELLTIINHVIIVSGTAFSVSFKLLGARTSNRNNDDQDQVRIYTGLALECLDHLMHSREREI